MMLVGIQLGAIYYLTGNLWLSIPGNFIIVSSNWVRFYLYQVGLATEDPINPTATSPYSAVISLIITAALLWYLSKRRPKPVVIIEYQTDIDSIGK